MFFFQMSLFYLALLRFIQENRIKPSGLQAVGEGLRVFERSSRVSYNVTHLLCIQADLKSHLKFKLVSVLTTVIEKYVNC